ncbi:MAG: beta-ketoacyl-ACP synthase [Nitratireductor sp.]|nr:beta-ketoacyl-ACP synthase [Nitratireductor sp.]
MNNREVWITGIGLVSCFGEGAGHHWETLGGKTAPAPVIDSERFKPYSVHPLPEMDWSKQIPRRGDQRQMENWQRLGTYTAGLALEDAGIKDNEEIVGAMDLVVAAGGGERDIAVDDSIMADAVHRNDREKLLNERLPFDLRPTLFLAQLSNLLAGNISIVHKVTGSSRTYMGEETAGITAIQNAVSRIQAGQSTHLLVGGAFNAERIDLFLTMELGHFVYRGEPAGIHARQANGGGMISGSAGAFLVLEDAEFARKRGATPYARLSSIVSDLGSREPQAASARLDTLLNSLEIPSGTAVVSGASGHGPATELEFAAIERKFGKDVATRAFTTMIGNPIEANFPAGIALAAMAIRNGGFFAPFEAAEKPLDGAPSSVLVSTIGHNLGEGFGLVEKV